MPAPQEPSASNVLRTFAVLFGLLAVSNLLKPLGVSAETGFVFLGRRLTGMPNMIAAWAFAALLGSYAASIWRRSAAALPLGIAFACYVSANLFLFTLRSPVAEGNAKIFGLVYTLVALGGAWGAVAAMVREGYGRLDPEPGRVLMRSFAMLFALMALSNVLKPFAYSAETGFVLLGHRLSGTPNVVAALTFAAVLSAYAVGIWSEKRYAVSLGAGYALYVLANLVAWNFYKPEGTQTPILFAIPYLISAIGVSSGSAVLLWRHRERFQ